jgi:adenosylcobinamide-GDP ribazoletransferase
MRDSRLGTHGGLALVFVLVAKIWLSANSLCAVLHSGGVGGLCRRARLRGGDDVWSSLRPRRGLGNLFIGKVTFTQTVITLALALLVAVGLEGHAV